MRTAHLPTCVLHNEQVWTCLGERLGPGSLYSEVQCIMGNSHMGHSTLTPVDRYDWKHYLSATSLAGSNKEAYIFQVINQPPWLRLTDTIWCHIFLQNRTVADVHRRILDVPLSA